MPSFRRRKPEVSRLRDGNSACRRRRSARRWRGWRNGSACASFLERCRRIFSEIDAAELELSKTQEAPRGTLRVSLPLVGMLMMPTLVAFMQAYPEIILD